MVLDKLSDSLKNTLKKITSAVFVDEKLVNELVKDVQRSLLQSDVNVKLVLDLTNKIKERVLKEESPKTLSKKEYLIQVLYEELTKFLGGSGAKIEMKKKPFKLMLVGLFGNGKCVHGASNVLLSTGETVTIASLYEHFRKTRPEYKEEDGFIIPLEDEVYVPSFNPKTLKMEEKRVSCLWRLKSKALCEVSLDNGNHFKVRTTSEHPFFILQEGKVRKKRADELFGGDFVAIPAQSGWEPQYKDLSDPIRGMNLDVQLSMDQLLRAKKVMREKWGTLGQALRSIPYKRNYAKFTHSLKKGQLPFMLCPKIEEKIKMRFYQAQDWVAFPTRLTPELGEFIGYILGDGYLSKNTINVSNADPEIIERIKKLSWLLFSKNISITKDKRRKSLVALRLNSRTLVEILCGVFGLHVGRKGRNLGIPSVIQTATEDIVSSFVRAYFDCDAHFSTKQRQIELVSESERLIRQMQHLLLRFNILGTQIKKKVNGESYYRFLIQARGAEFFYEKIGSLVHRKKVALKKYHIIGKEQGDGKLDMIPVSNLLKKLRGSAGYSINQIQQEVSSYGLYEEKGVVSRTQLRKIVAFYEKGIKGNFARLVQGIASSEKLPEDGINRSLRNALVGEFKRKGFITEERNSSGLVLTLKGEQLHLKLSQGMDFEAFKTLQLLAYSSLSWVRVKKVVSVANDLPFVYDLTVEDNHTFIADGIIVHNTTTAGKLAHYYKKRGLKVAVMTTDTWRPAAFDQLEQLAKKVGVDFMGDKKSKDPAKIFKKFEPELSKYDLVIVDTAGRDALSEELITELNSIHKAVKADETLLVMGADLGQAAEKQAKTFHETCGVTGILITKLDGTAKGGGALAAAAITGAPVKFIGIGEKVDDLEEFRPEGFVGRLLGMGDLEALLEKAKGAISEEEAQDLGKKFLKGDFSLLDLYEQMQAVRKMGPLTKIMEMIPGMSQVHLPKEMLEVQEGKLIKWKFIMDSCTKEELENPEEMDGSRVDRIAKGSGCSSSEIRSLLKQYKQSKKMVKMFKGGSEKDMQKMMKQFQGKMPFKM
ncbi:MAG TPA: LAGLIDADG family homing endonuclease [Candidatus Nanoarchaeia archaeon]|nr:LAGLIDADG family homing endonuclease [Candidatus Nanoarchaeia archaeon]